MAGGLGGVFLVFARVGAAMMVLPGFGERYVLPRLRLAFAILVSVLLAPVVVAPDVILPSEPLASRFDLSPEGEIVMRDAEAAETPVEAGVSTKA